MIDLVPTGRQYLQVNWMVMETEIVNEGAFHKSGMPKNEVSMLVSLVNLVTLMCVYSNRVLYSGNLFLCARLVCVIEKNLILGT